MPDDTEAPTTPGTPVPTAEELIAQETTKVETAIGIVSRGLAWSHNPKSDLSPYDQQQNNAAGFGVLVEYARRGLAVTVAEMKAKPNRQTRRQQTQPESKPKSPRGKRGGPKLEAVPAAEA